MRKGIKKKSDSGFRGAEKLHFGQRVIAKGIRHRPLTQEDKVANRKLAKEKDVNNLFGQNPAFKLSGEAEAATAEEQPGRISRTNENEQAPVRNAAASSQNYFYSHL